MSVCERYFRPVPATDLVWPITQTFVSNLLATGADPKLVQALAGHANVQTTLKHYAAVRAKNLRAAVDRLSQLNESAG